jgi:hypothetical protein
VDAAEESIRVEAGEQTPAHEIVVCGLQHQMAYLLKIGKTRSQTYGLHRVVLSQSERSTPCHDRKTTSNPLRSQSTHEESEHRIHSWSVFCLLFGKKHVVHVIESRNAHKHTRAANRF